MLFWVPVVLGGSYGRNINGAGSSPLLSMVPSVSDEGLGEEWGLGSTLSRLEECVCFAPKAGPGR